jgi:hypothetical protein
LMRNDRGNGTNGDFHYFSVGDIEGLGFHRYILL